MSHWSDSYLGLPWIEGKFDCADLTTKIQLEVFGKTIKLPTSHGESHFGRAATIAVHKDVYVEPIEIPEDGDGVLLLARGRIQHIGTYCLIDGEPWVLHNQQGAGTHRLRLRDLKKWHYTVEGFYRWK